VVWPPTLPACRTRLPRTLSASEWHAEKQIKTEAFALSNVTNFIPAVYATTLTKRSQAVCALIIFRV